MRNSDVARVMEEIGGLMRLRGMEVNAADGFAEAFVARKLRMGP